MPNLNRRRAVFTPLTSIYLMRDTFDTTRAAGAVNATPIDGFGGGTRVAADTGPVQSIAAGKLTVAGGLGSPAWGDPGCWLPGKTRIPGLTCGFKVNVSTIAGNGVGLGWAINATGEPFGHCLVLRATTIFRAYDNASVIQVGPTLSTGVDYQVAISLRATGAFYFIKGGIYTNWTLVWISTLLTTATMYPAISNWSCAYTVDDAYVFNFVPNALASDSFTRSNGALGTTDGAGHPEANSGQGLTWTAQTGTWAIASNIATAPALSGGIAIATVPVGSADVIHNVKATRAAGNVGSVVRYQDANNYVYAYHDGTNAKLIKVVAGVETTVITAAATYSAGAVLRIVCSGTYFELYYNNTRVSTGGTIADAALQSSAVVGLYTSDITNSLDDMTAWPIGTANEHGRLDLFF